MNFTLLPGYVLISRDPIIGAPQGVILAPDASRLMSTAGLCLLHVPGSYWDYIQEEVSLTNKRVYFEKWGGRLFSIQDTEFWVFPEESILGVEEPWNATN